MTVFGGNGRNGFAIGLALGICLTLIFCVWSLGVGQVVKSEADAESPSQQTEGYADQQQDLLPWWEHDGVLVTSKDTLAQWAMALLGLIATALSAWAVILLKRTLLQTAIATKAAQESVSVTEKMGRLQTQAYLSFNGTDLHFLVNEGVPISVHVRAKFRNTGQSPGKIVYGFCHIAFLADLEAPFHPRVERTPLHRTTVNVGPGEVRWIASHPIPINELLQALSDRRSLVVYGCVEFTDVFDQVRRIEEFCAGIGFYSDPSKMTDGITAAHEWHAHQDYSVTVS